MFVLQLVLHATILYICGAFALRSSRLRQRERWDEEKQVRHGSAIRCLDRLAERPVLNFLPSLCVGFKGI